MKKFYFPEKIILFQNLKIILRYLKFPPLAHQNL
jgi:hypothetical protein